MSDHNPVVPYNISGVFQLSLMSCDRREKCLGSVGHGAEKCQSSNPQDFAKQPENNWYHWKGNWLGQLKLLEKVRKDDQVVVLYFQ